MRSRKCKARDTRHGKFLKVFINTSTAHFQSTQLIRSDMYLAYFGRQNHLALLLTTRIITASSVIRERVEFQKLGSAAIGSTRRHFAKGRLIILRMRVE